MNEASKSYTRRRTDPIYAELIRGKVLDVGCGNDLMQSAGFPVELVKGYDLTHGHIDAATLPEIATESYNTVHSSHCLEHLADPHLALVNWLRVLRPRGCMVVTVPDFDLYEHGRWPSMFNADHKCAFTMTRLPSDFLRYVPSMLHELSEMGLGEVLICKRCDDGFDWNAPVSYDQTLGACECAIEFVFRKA